VLWGFLTMGTVLSDVRYTLRQMRLTPVFTITVILTLGLASIFPARRAASIDPVVSLREE
jgi:ABC-type lipoprotein release transport system permease subunit